MSDISLLRSGFLNCLTLVIHCAPWPPTQSMAHKAFDGIPVHSKSLESAWLLMIGTHQSLLPVGTDLHLLCDGLATGRDIQTAAPNSPWTAVAKAISGGDLDRL